ncbi:MAG: filamentous hemagglutinin family protein [Pseudomonadota bacterium]
MHSRDIQAVRRSRGRKGRVGLLCGVSAFALVMTGAPVRAMPLGTTRGGGSYSAAVNAAAAAVAGAQQSSAVAQQSMSALTRAVQAVQAMQQAQAAARALAQQAPSGVPNGLAVGGLQVAPGAMPGSSLWQNADLPTQSTVAGETNVTIRQQAARAILTWQSFDVGQNTTLTFDQQGNPNWVALNRVVDPSQRPSQILGSIKADGQVYVINPNGIVFGGASQVNVGALVASTADIADSQFLTNGIYSTQTNNVYAPSFTDAAGAIVVEPGAQIVTNTPASVTQGGGFVLMMGTQVTNAGTIVTPDGQTELAAGDDFVLRPGYGTTANTTSTTRGNEIGVELDQQGSSLAGGAGVVTNTGYIEADTGDITLAGETVAQDGVALSTTSVNVRGTIHLLSSASDPDSSVTLASGSATLILPDTSTSRATAYDSQRSALIAASAGNSNNATGQFDDLSTLADLEDESRIEIVSGGTVEFANGSQTTTPAGQIAVSATRRVQVDTGALLNVAGDAAVLPMSANDLLVNVQGNEQRDDPNNRDTSDLNNSDLWVDERQLTYVAAGTGGYTSARDYTAGGVLEVSGELNNVGHTIEEWSTIGGTITLATGANGSVVAQPGAIFNISGGSVTYEAGYIQQSYLIGADGNIYNVNTAPADLTYTGVYNGFVVAHEHWGITQHFESGLRPTQIWESGYTVGRDAGGLILSTPTAIFEGDIEAGVTDGVFQDEARPANVSDPYTLPQGVAPLAGRLALGQYSSFGEIGAYDTDVVFGAPAAIASSLSVGSTVPGTRTDTAWFDASALTSDGLGGLNVATSGTITVSTPLTLAEGAQVTLTAPDIDISADLNAHGGAVTLTNIMHAVLGAGQNEQYWALTDASGASQIMIDGGSTIDLTGLWTNAVLDPATISGLAFEDGGDLTVSTTGGVTLASGSTIDVSSGGGMGPGGKMQGGTGGSVTLAADDYSKLSGDQELTADLTKPLIVDGTIRGYGFTGGGTLTLDAGQSVVLGHDAALMSGTLAANTPAETSLVLAQSITIPAGTKMPMDYLVVQGNVPLDTPLPTSFGVYLPSTGIKTAAAWTVPSSMIVTAGGTTYYGGSLLPAGSVISTMTSIPAGTILPSAVFAQGIPASQAAISASYSAGEVLTAPVTLPTGTVIPVGASFEQAVAIEPVSSLSPGLFQSGFSNYNVSSNTGILVAADIAPAVPVYRFAQSSINVQSGAPVTQAADLWLPPEAIANPLADTLTQRAGASLKLSSLYDFNLQPGASLTVDPGESVSIYANRQTTLDGDITARGGSILVTSLQDSGQISYGGGYGDFALTRSIWVGEGATLDVSGEAFTAIDGRGRSYGFVQDGGTIKLGGIGKTTTPDNGTVAYPIASEAFVVVRPGAKLEASGTSTTVDILSNTSFDLIPRPTFVASDGGEIALYSADGIYLDGTLEAAAGGVGAAGGTLIYALADPAYASGAPTSSSPYSAGISPYDVSNYPYVIGGIPAQAAALRNITLVQESDGSGIAADAAPGEADTFLQFGQAVLGVNQIQAAGFDNVALYTHDFIAFDGNVDLHLGGSLTLSGAVLAASPSTPDIAVRLSAPYIHLTGWDSTGTIVGQGVYYPGLNTVRGPSLNTASDSSFTLAADLIDIDGAVQFGAHGHQGSGDIAYYDISTLIGAPQTSDVSFLTGADIVDVPGFNEVNLDSSGDIRFGNGSFYAPNLTIRAGQVYPLSGAVNTIEVGLYLPASGFGGIGTQALSPNGVLTILGTGGAASAVPASVFGGLSLNAATIVQDGVLRAPLGVIAFNEGIGAPNLYTGNLNTSVTFGAGSVTSTSAAGLTMPYGGTSDGVTYNGIGTLDALGATDVTVNGQNEIATGIAIAAVSVVGEKGAVLDVSGGGELTGAGFISGRGGSLDTLTTPLVNSNPANASFSGSGDKIYAIVPGYAAKYAPEIASNGAGDPAIGEQITISAGVPGLPAGTYTLLPSSYALLPGGYRVEIGSSTDVANGSVPLGNGSLLTTGTLSIANTGVHEAMPVRVVLSSGTAVRDYSQYNETSYANFATTQATLFGGVRPRLPEDGGALEIDLGLNDTFKFDGTALFTGAGNGIDGALIVGSPNGAVIDITAAGASPVSGHVSISSDVVNAFDAPTVMIGGGTAYFDDTGYGTGPRIYFTGEDGTINVESGADLRAGQIFLNDETINVASGATLDSHGLGSNGLDSTDGYLYGNVESANDTNGPAILAVANGWFNFLPVIGSGTINVETGASLLTDGSIVLAAAGNLTMGDADLGARYLTVSQNEVNIGTAASLAAAQAAGALPQGWNLTQDVLDTLLAPPAESGLPALEELTLTAGAAVNLFGTVALNASGRNGTDVTLVINTPAIYGLGGAGDVASIKANSFIWNGIRTGNGGTGNPSVPYGSGAPAPVVAGGPGTGQGTLDIDANDIMFGYDQNSRATDGVTLDRIALGFANVDLIASDKVTANSDGTLTVGQTTDSSGAPVGGNLTLTTPLYADENGATLSYKAGGAIALIAPAGAKPADAANVADIGGTVTFSGSSIFVDTTVALPSGQLTLNATGQNTTDNVTLGGGADIDLSGRAIAFDDQVEFSWGGNLIMTSAGGSIRQQVGSVIDVSAVDNNAGSVFAAAIGAGAGQVSFGGTLRGALYLTSADLDTYRSGTITVEAQTLTSGTVSGLSADFAALNDALNSDGFFWSRSFDLKQGDLAVGDDVHAHQVNITADGGSLTINGTIDASGTTNSAGLPGSITLAAQNDLTLNGRLDAHGTVLQADSNGQPIDSENRAKVDLTATTGTLTLASGAAINVSSLDPTPQGDVELNVTRTGETSGDANIAAPVDSAGNHVAISGEASIAVNAFWTYTPTDPNGTIVQDNQDPGGNPIAASGNDAGYVGLKQIDARSQQFIDAAYDNDVAAGLLTANLQSKLAGLTKYGTAFHLRPGVAITSSGNLTTSGDLDFSGYRYGPNADAMVRGSGEPGALVIRAANNLDINGSINDGFAPPPVSPDALTVLASGTLTSDYTVTGNAATLAAGAEISRTATINIPLTYASGTRIVWTSVTAPLASHPLPVDIVLAASYTPVAAARGRIVYGTIYAPDGSVLISSGQSFTAANVTTLPAGTKIAAGTYFSVYLSGVITIESVTVPAGANLADFNGYTFSQATQLPPGTVIPSGTANVTLTGPGNRQFWAISPMLSAGTQSWSMTLVGGADLSSANVNALQPPTKLGGAGNVVLDDPYQVDLSGTGKIGTGVSVIRTGTGDLSILAGGNYEQESPYGVYTAGTAIDVGDAYNPSRGKIDGTTVLGATNSGYEATLGSQYMYFTQDGGDVTLAAQGDVTGYQAADSTQIGGWLWREGGGGINQLTAWGINFGSYTAQVGYGGPYVGLSTFSGVGALGGGNVTVAAGGDIGDAASSGAAVQGIVAAVAGSGRVLADGSLVQTGGGALTVTAGGNIGTGGNQFVDLRGNINILTGNFGSMAGTFFGVDGNDPRLLSALVPYSMKISDGGTIAPGDSAVNIDARGELALGAIYDPGRVGLEQETQATSAAGTGLGATWFTLWTDKTALDLFAAGNLAPFSASQGTGNYNEGTSSYIIPSILDAISADANIYLDPGQNGASFMMPSSDSVVNILAAGSIVENSEDQTAFGPLSTSLATMPTPLKPAWATFTVSGTSETVLDSNYWGNPTAIVDNVGNPIYGFNYDATAGYSGVGGQMFIFGPDTVSDDSAAPEDGLVSHIYARGGDVLNLHYGEIYKSTQYLSGQDIITDYYRAAKPVEILAGGDIYNIAGLILQSDPNDVSMIAAQGNLIYGNVDIAGPGTLEVTAGKNLYEGSTGYFDSIGALVTGDNRAGANVVLQAGVGPGTPGVGAVDWSGFAALYLNPANEADASLADTDPANAGKVPHTYQNELVQWLSANYGYSGGESGAYVYFETLPAPQQRVFLRKVYYGELNEGGLEYNDPSSKRYQSYLRGREAIAALFPDKAAYSGNIILFSAATGTPGKANYNVNSGYVHTDFGGNIQFLAPGGEVQIGTNGLAPGASAGLITQGEGDIDVYSDQSVLLGLSRIMTTFGGDILIWSATGDINAGRGSKTTVVYTPPKRVYDNYGNITLSPQAPSTGAGIATLNPIPQVPAGNINLVAPEGTIDAGEAGIRVSGNLNVAALQIVNAANITVQGTTTGVPTVAAPNIGALDSASSAAGAATKAIASPAQNNGNNIQPSILIVEIEGYGGESEGAPLQNVVPKKHQQQSQNGDSYDPNGAVELLGNGRLSENQETNLTPEERARLNKVVGTNP